MHGVLLANFYSRIGIGWPDRGWGLDVWIDSGVVDTPQNALCGCSLAGQGGIRRDHVELEVKRDRDDKYHVQFENGTRSGPPKIDGVKNGL